jgi:ubiquinone/menaquinone biosynthesis C-methylase UbiE
MKSFNEGNIQLFNKTILDDAFNDTYQNEDLYNGYISGTVQLNRLLDNKDIQRIRDITDPRQVLNVGAGQANLTLFPRHTQVENLEPCPQRKKEGTIEGWSENIPNNAHSYDVIVCWGVLCFVRGLPETMIEFNRVLKQYGHLVVDTVTYSTMALAQTVHPDSFVRWAGLFGFELEEKIEFGEHYHQRMGYRFKRVANFDPTRFRMPQCEGKINNYLPERDWFMR